MGREAEEKGGGGRRRLGTDSSAYLRPCLCSTDQLPRPSLVALPGPVVAPGANVSLRCGGRIPGMSFALYRVGVATPLQYIDSVQPWADFLLIGTNAPGTYCCYYHTPSAPYVLSQRSQPLVISYKGKMLWLSSFRPRGPGDINSIKLRDNSIVCVRNTEKAPRLWDKEPTPCLPLSGSQVLAPWTIPGETSSVWGWQEWSSSAWAS